MNPLEAIIRKLVAAIAAAKGKSGLELAIMIIPLAMEIQQAVAALKGVDQVHLVVAMREAIDNVVGNEPDALIGPNDNALIKVDVPYVGLEAITDLLLTGAENAYLAQSGENS